MLKASIVKQVQVACVCGIEGCGKGGLCVVLPKRLLFIAVYCLVASLWPLLLLVSALAERPKCVTVLPAGTDVQCSAYYPPTLLLQRGETLPRGGAAERRAALEQRFVEDAV